MRSSPLSSPPLSSPTARPPTPPRAESLWASMQHTLSEVELSNTAIFFGPSHAKALEDLRAAQIALAQAWMIDSDEPEVGRAGGLHGTQGSQAGGSQAHGAQGSQGSQAHTTTGQIQGQDLKVQGTHGEAEDKRKASEMHFNRVAQGVVEVAERLEKVAQAMRGVERESRGVWEEETIESESVRGSCR
ncbi:hypothetical protein FPQ18DRAFT_82252 [Pyronema domesticum]|uniref:Uncharacterized protein n=1 Tax=Pyronema omphalodes (strain CBS 100304) TaxID=1076935 RepID=U4LMC4_PYROM|nr:hypothetical protein FPQ18DRAFT_82252 [Pyronema domesticum]CCX33093.1 Similar to hypothetical protein BC1G_03778 [Botryotinia fuckeliana B05.10]; acc. no. XP_001557681 [Pyronema omphalodes CBS 100304]